MNIKELSDLELLDLCTPEATDELARRAAEEINETINRVRRAGRD